MIIEERLLIERSKPGLRAIRLPEVDVPMTSPADAIPAQHYGGAKARVALYQAGKPLAAQRDSVDLLNASSGMSTDTGLA